MGEASEPEEEMGQIGWNMTFFKLRVLDPQKALARKGGGKVQTKGTFEEGGPENMWTGPKKKKKKRKKKGSWNNP